MKSRLPKGYGSGQATNMSQIAKQAQKIQEEMEKVSVELDQKEYTVSTGGNAVTVTMLGKLEITNLTISPEAIDPEDPESHHQPRSHRPGGSGNARRHDHRRRQ